MDVTNRNRALTFSAIALFVVGAAVAFLVTRDDPPSPASPGVANGLPIDAIFDTSTALFTLSGNYRATVAAAEEATKGDTRQPVTSSLPGPDKSADVWLYRQSVGYRYGDNLVIETMPFTLNTTAESYLKSNADVFGGTVTTINGFPALVRGAYTFEASEREEGDSTIVVPKEAVDTTVIDMIVGDTEIILYGRELTADEVVKVAESLR